MPRPAAVAWTVRPGGPLRGAPTVADGNVYVMSQDNQIFSLKASDGTTNWSNAAALEIAGVFGNGVAGGRPRHRRRRLLVGRAQRLSLRKRPPGVAGRAVADVDLDRRSASLSDIDADPVIANGVVYAIGQGGRMVALDLISGQRMWELNFAGIATPWVAGDWLFAVNDQAQLIAVAARRPARSAGSTSCRAAKRKKKAGPISYVGPVLAGDRLIVAGQQWRADQRRPDQRQLPEPDQRRRRRQLPAGGREQHAVTC